MMWVIIFAATERRLKEEEVRELRRLSGLIEKGVARRDEYNKRVEAFCLEIFSSGVLEHRQVDDLGDLLLKIDELRDLLK
jgi:hypothetical protein